MFAARDARCEAAQPVGILDARVDVDECAGVKGDPGFAVDAPAWGCEEQDGMRDLPGGRRDGGRAPEGQGGFGGVIEEANVDDFVLEAGFTRH